MNYNTILYEKSEGIALIRLNRPKSLNALCRELIDEIDHVVNVIGDDQEVAVAIITGSEKAFAAGADIKEIAQLATPLEAYRHVAHFHAVFDKIEALPKPVIAAVSGFALGGGCELALACDMRIAAENASFGLPEIKLGVIPGGGGTQRLPRLVGVGRAKEMLYTGDPIDAREAHRIGLANKVVAVDALMEETRRLASRLVKQPAVALRMNKQAVNEGIRMDPRSGLAYELHCFGVLFSTQDQKEGVQAFIEKRPAKFNGR